MFREKLFFFKPSDIFLEHSTRIGPEGIGVPQPRWWTSEKNIVAKFFLKTPVVFRFPNLAHRTELF